jgi:hypothetical protein
MKSFNQFIERFAAPMSRFRQGIRALLAWACPVNIGQASKVLSPELLALFQKMRRSEQQHSLNVLRTLQGWGYDDPALLTAALLHDVGKTRAPFHLWDRVLVVLTRAAAPTLAKRLGQNPSKRWSRPFAVSYQHPAWSAEMVAAAGADPLVVELIATHQHYLDHPPQSATEQLLTALQAADDVN